MDHFLLYAARLQDRGIVHLKIVIDTAEDRTRIMRVRPDISRYSPTVYWNYPERVFDLTGTDRVLESLTDDLFFSNDGKPTEDQVKAVIAKHPIYKDDLTDWYNSIKDSVPIDEEDLRDCEEDLNPDSVKRSQDHIRGLLKGLDISRKLRTLRPDQPEAATGEDDNRRKPDDPQ